MKYATVVLLGCHLPSMAEIALYLASQKTLEASPVYIAESKESLYYTLSLQGLTLQESDLEFVHFSDPDTACICHNPAVIDSMVKVLEEYPALKDAYKTAEILIHNEAELRDDQREKILKYLGLKYWDMSDIRKRIRRLKWQKVWYGSGSFLVGTVTGAFLIYRIVKP